jgi:PDZ domain-containing protein
VIVSANGTPVDTLAKLHKVIVKNGASKAVQLVIRRGGVESTVSIVPRLSTGSSPAPYIGIVPSNTYTFPFTVKIQLQNVGGPSAGQMLALGIIDKLTPGALNGGAEVAGTGTIDRAGTVGAIGGIRQKMYGAVGKGATYFLAPASNCNEVVGHVPKGLTVFAVKTLDDSLAALSAIKSGSGTATLPTCTAK